MQLFLVEYDPTKPDEPIKHEVWVQNRMRDEVKALKLKKGDCIEAVLYRHTWEVELQGGGKQTHTRHNLAKIIRVDRIEDAKRSTTELPGTSISKSWRTHWNRVIPLFAFSEDIRKVICTTNAIESVNMTLRKVTRNHRIFPSDEAVYKVVYLAIRNIAKKWTMPIHDWKPALNRFAIEFAGRFPQ